MIERILKRPLRRAGYKLVPANVRPGDNVIYEVYPYLTTDGNFDYERYRKIQNQGNKEKIDRVWVVEENIAFLSNYLQKMLGTPQFGVCHGTRRGNEQVWFRKYLKCDVFGTEIADTATDFPFTIQWDFHNVKPEWINHFDFIYSNSFDHSYDPEKCLNAWVSCVRPGGFCIIEHSDFDTRSWITELDPFGADIAVMPYLIALWGKGRYAVREIVDAPAVPSKLRYLKFLVIQRFA